VGQRAQDQGMGEIQQAVGPRSDSSSVCWVASRGRVLKPKIDCEAVQQVPATALDLKMNRLSLKVRAPSADKLLLGRANEAELSKFPFKREIKCTQELAVRTVMVHGGRVHGVFGVRPNVRAKRAPTAGRQARAGENVPRTARPGLVARRWCSA
jgi:hypothetical protein